MPTQRQLDIILESELEFKPYNEAPMPLSKNKIEQIKKDAEAYMHSEVKGMVGDAEIYMSDLMFAYQAGATAESERSQEIEAKAQKMVDVLYKISHAPVPANEREYISWFVTAKNIAGGVLSEIAAEKKEGKEAANGTT